MKTLKISLLALLMTVGIGGAVVQKIQAAPKPDDVTYNWSRVGGSTVPNEQSPFNGKTIAQAQSNYGCAGTGSPCAEGVDPTEQNVNAVIKLN
jgi:hypothetical protein